MPDSSANWPTNWEAYEYGRSNRNGSEGSLGSHVQFDESRASRAHLLRAEEGRGVSPLAGSHLRHRRSSLSMKLSSVTHAGGPNSLEAFARSWSRAANFIEIPPRPPSFVIEEGGEDSVGSRRSREPFSPAESRGLLRQQLERDGSGPSEAVDDTADAAADDGVSETRQPRHDLSERPSGIFDRARLSSPFASSYGGTYGSLPSRANDASIRHASMLYRDQQATGAYQADKEQEPLLVKVVEQEDGTKIHMVVGQSTLPQTIFNSINVLIGVGLLSLPLGLKQAGWLVGMVFLFLAAIVTRYTGGLLAKALDVDHSLLTFSDLAWKAFGHKARVAVGLLFTLELIAACVALIILFADSLSALIPSLGVTEWKVLCGIIMVPLSFVPLRYLSFTSVLGIVSCLGIVILIFADGFIKPHSPGSLREPTMASLWPKRWSDLPLSFGLLMSPWGGHSVFPNIYRDMRHPKKYIRAINYTYMFTYLLDLAVAVAGYLMFGQHVQDEITSNIFLTQGYPEGISVAIVIFIAIIPITKIPLNARPIYVITETALGLHPTSTPPTSTLFGLPSYTRGFLIAVTRVLTLAIMVVLAIVVPGFDTVMALMGSAMAFSICIILPVAFNLKIFHNEITRREKALDWFLILVCSVMALMGTVWVFIPRHAREALDGW